MNQALYAHMNNKRKMKKKSHNYAIVKAIWNHKDNFQIALLLYIEMKNIKVQNPL
jgi:hypothetical protein